MKKIRKQKDTISHEDTILVICKAIGLVNKRVDTIEELLTIADKRFVIIEEILGLTDPIVKGKKKNKKKKATKKGKKK